MATTSTLLWQRLQYTEWAGQALLPTEAPLQMLSPVQQIIGFTNRCFFSGPQVQSRSAPLQSVWPAEATQARPPAAGSGSVGSRIHVSRTDLALKTRLWRRSGVFGEMGKKWLWTMWRDSEKSTGACCQCASRIQYFSQDPAPLICLPNVPPALPLKYELISCTKLPCVLRLVII